MPSRRQERVAKRVIQETVEALRTLKHVQLGFVTVTGCEMSPDLRHAKVFLSVWGDAEEQEKTLHRIRMNASKLRGIITRPLGLKNMPMLHFEIDETIATADRMARLIRDARQTDAHPEPLTEEEAAALMAVSDKSRKSDGRQLDEDDEEFDPFEAARIEVEDDLLDSDDDDDDAAWRPINLDELPDDDDGLEERDGK